MRQVGEVVGSLKALMVLKHEISINQRQCCLLFDTIQMAFDTISEDIRQNLRLDEKNTKWKALELPLKELHRVLKDAECYIRYCMDIKDWWGKAISLHTSRDCVELHLHNLLSSFTVVVEAIETAAEISGADEDAIQKKRSALLQKYDQECDDPKFFLWKYGKQFLVPREVCRRMETAWREDRWLLNGKVGERKSGGVAKTEQKLAELLLRKLSDVEASKKVMSSNMLVGAEDYQVRRRLGSGYPTGPGHLKEIHWLGESFALRTFIGDLAPLLPEISSLLSLSHPNIMQYLCAFYDEGRKEGFLVMELMAKDLGSYIKEHSGQRNRVPFTIPVAVDIMLQIARGMEYLHSINIHHGDLNPSHILLKARNTTTGGFQAKVTGFGMPGIKRCATRSSPKPVPAPAPAVDGDIWLAPELLAELEQAGGKGNVNYTEKCDVYSFGMLCFELLTGKVPFEDGHLQGEQMGRNIRAGERPLFSHPSPKCLVNLTKKCWQTNPSLRPSFSSICRVLRYMKKILVINPDHGLPDSPPPLVDYCDLEAAYLKKFPGEGTGALTPVTQIPFQMVAYKVVEKEKTITKKWDMATEGMVRPPASIFDEDQLAAMDDLFLVPTDRRSVCSDIIDSKNSAVDVDLRTVISETMQRKLYHFDSFVPEIPRKKFPKPPTAPEISLGKNVDEENSKSEQKSPTSASSDEKRLPEIPEKKRTFVKKLQNIKTKPISETPKHEAPTSSPARAKKAGASFSAAASPSRALSKTTMLSSSPSASASPSRSFKNSIRGGMRSSNSPASSPAREFRPKNESTMQSPNRMKKTVVSSNSPASSPSRGPYNVCPSPIHPSVYNTYPISPISSPMNPNIRPSRLGGMHPQPSDSSSQINYPI